MFSFTLVSLILAIHVLAAPANPDPAAKTILEHDDVLVLNGDGTTSVMKDFEYEQLQNRAAKRMRQALASSPGLPHGTTQSRRTELGTRGCEESSEVQVLTDTTFLNWDVAVSPVVSALGGDASVSVSEGYSISDGISVSASADLNLIQDVLGISFSTSYTQSWTTTNTQTISFAVPAGQYGLIVSEPSTRRLTGNYLTGCTDDWTATSFVADSYTSTSWGGMEWPQGVIRLCNSTSYPVPYCIGDGSHS